MILVMKVKELVTNYLVEPNLELVKKTIFIPVSHILQSNGSMSNVIDGSDLLPPLDYLMECNINSENEYISVTDGLNTLCHYFDKSPRARIFLARMVEYSMNHPKKILILLFDDDECDNFNYLNFFREYFYYVFDYPCLVCMKGIQYKDRDRYLLDKVLLNPDKKYIENIYETIEDIRYEYHLYRQEIWKSSVNRRIREFSKMTKGDLYKECQYVICDLEKKSEYSKEDLIALLSEYYGTGVSDQEAYQSSLYKAMNSNK